MNQLLELAVMAHGGLKRWNELSTVEVSMNVGGVLWQAKGVPGFAAISHITARLHEQVYSVQPFLKADQKTHFENGRIAIENLNGKLIRAWDSPREHFAGHMLETQWEDLHLAYFNAYATWTYLTLPFVLATKGFEVEEVQGRIENGEAWRALKAQFPPNLAYHSREQIFYFGPDGLLRRLDYDVDVSKGARGAHYVYDHKEFDGIVVPTRRLVWAPDANNDPVKEPLVVSVEITKVKFY